MLKIDGGLSTALERRGANLNSILWTGKLIGDAPEILEQAHTDFINCGAQIITTASYQISFIGEQVSGLADSEVTRLLVAATAIAKRAKQNAIESGNSKRSKVEVAASIGPYGAALGDGSEYRGNYAISNQELQEFHSRRIEVLLDSKPDLFAVETIPSIKEAIIIQEILSQESFPYWISFTCKDELKICEGDLFSDAVAALKSDTKMLAIGLNCTNPNYVESLLNSAKTPTDLIVYPNLGKTWDANTKTWIGEAVDFNLAVPRWIELGAKYIGGCCGVGPAELSELKLN